mmetsp:Transcript_119337/g.380561  ORF Transcript_119337/g.380561 Transcript_119337/m.380561 type:complete len:286 (-) Transcript_119337:659-1516(-)
MAPEAIQVMLAAWQHAELLGVGGRVVYPLNDLPGQHRVRGAVQEEFPHARRREALHRGDGAGLLGRQRAHAKQLLARGRPLATRVDVRQHLGQQVRRGENHGTTQGVTDEAYTNLPARRCPSTNSFERAKHNSESPLDSLIQRRMHGRPADAVATDALGLQHRRLFRLVLQQAANLLDLVLEGCFRYGAGRLVVRLRGQSREERIRAIAAARGPAGPDAAVGAGAEHNDANRWNVGLSLAAGDVDLAAVNLDLAIALKRIARWAGAHRGPSEGSVGVVRIGVRVV